MGPDKTQGVEREGGREGDRGREGEREREREREGGRERERGREGGREGERERGREGERERGREGERERERERQRERRRGEVSQEEENSLCYCIYYTVCIYYIRVYTMKHKWDQKIDKSPATIPLHTGQMHANHSSAARLLAF